MTHTGALPAAAVGVIWGIIGGALMPPVIGLLGGLVGLRQGMFVLYLTLGYILSIGLWARPLIVNETIAMKRKKEAA